MTLPGNPFIYYGDELGMKGSRVEGVTIDGYDAPVYDEYRRQPFLWGDESKTTTWFPNHGTNDTPTYLEQKDDENSLFNFTKELITLRKENPALMDGLEIYNYRDLDNAQSYIRVINNDNVKQALLVIHNVRNENIEIDLDLEVVYGSKTLKPKSMVILEIPFNKLDDYR